MRMVEILKLAKQCHTMVKARDFRGNMQPLEPWMTTWLIEFYKVATSMEREECARICDELEKDSANTPKDCAEAIREMSNYD